MHNPFSFLVISRHISANIPHCIIIRKFSFPSWLGSCTCFICDSKRLITVCWMTKNKEEGVLKCSHADVLSLIRSVIKEKLYIEGEFCSVSAITINGKTRNGGWNGWTLRMRMENPTARKDNLYGIKIQNKAKGQQQQTSNSSNKSKQS